MAVNVKGMQGGKDACGKLAKSAGLPGRPARPLEARISHGRAKPLLRCVVGALIAVAGVQLAWGQDDTMTVTILGSGIPVPAADRFSASTLVQAGGKTLLFDAGRGATIRLRQLNVPLGQLTATFLTHFHSDHTVGLPDLWLTGWLPLPPHPPRSQAFVVVGPSGVGELVNGLKSAYKADIDIRVKDEKLPRSGADIETKEFSRDGVVFDEDGVRVTAFQVDHGEDIGPAFGYKVTYKSRSVVISGDTRYSPALIKESKGADLLLHEVADAAEPLKRLPAIQRILEHHTSPEEAGRVFSQARPRLAVYTHMALLGTPQAPAPLSSELAKATRTTYQGPLEVGEDLMRFVLGKQVSVQRFDMNQGRY